MTEYSEEKEVKKNILVRLMDKLLSPKPPIPSREKLPFKAWEWLVVIGICLFYASFAFAELGDVTLPQTKMFFQRGETIELTAPEDSYLMGFSWCLLDTPNYPIKVEIKEEMDSDWMLMDEGETKCDVGCWVSYGLAKPAKQIRITHYMDAEIREMELYDLFGRVVEPKNKEGYQLLFDEQNVTPVSISFKSVFYFDEMFYGLSANNFLIGKMGTEITHPPFGKILMSIGILLFGYNPFGIRFMGTLIGVLMLPCLYLLSRNVVQDRGIATFITFIFAFDFMHFVQTRIATIDVFVVFFIIIMYYFMERYLSLSFYDKSLCKTWVPLGCCGVAFGFGIATKWTGFYAGAGLALLFFGRLLRYYREYRYALLEPDEMSGEVSHSHIVQCFKKNVIRTILICFLFFVGIPFVIYLLSYIPFVAEEEQGLFARMIDNQKYMFNFHSTEEFEHAYTSRWYEWPLMIRPVRYFSSVYTLTTIRQSITGFGNPLVWWAGIPAFGFTLFMAIKKKSSSAVFLCVAYLAQYLPWMFISRPTFIYHYFTCVPFVTLMIGYCFLQIKIKLTEKNVLDNRAFCCLLIIYAAATYGVFQLFLPVLSGAEVSTFYIEDYLSWLKSWEFVI